MAVVGIPHWIGADQVADPVISSGALAIDSVTGKIKKGDGTSAFSALPTINGSISQVAAPASATATGTVGQTAFDATHFYVCIATNTWVRATLATW